MIELVCLHFELLFYKDENKIPLEVIIDHCEGHAIISMWKENISFFNPLTNNSIVIKTYQV